MLMKISMPSVPDEIRGLCEGCRVAWYRWDPVVVVIEI
jgi:hypothetical protein